MGQAQQKPCQHLFAFRDGRRPGAETVVVQNQMQSRCGHGRVQKGRQNAPQLLLHAFAHRPLAEAVAARYVESGHQRLAVDKEQKTGDRQPAAQIQRIALRCVDKDDGRHAYAFEQVKHPEGVDGTRFGSFHQRGPPRRTEIEFLPAGPAKKGRIGRFYTSHQYFTSKICSNLV